MHTDIQPFPETALAPAGGAGLILVVDDEEQNRLLLRDSLELHHYEVVEAQNGEEALRAIAQRPPEAILLDIMMPGMDGFALCRHLKGCPSTAPIPVLMVTALAERRERMIGIAAGANDFLTKPVDVQEMTLRVRNAVQVRRLFDQLHAEEQKSEQLLRSILPGAIIERMKKGDTNILDYHPEVTVLLATLAGASELISCLGPEPAVRLLNEIFSAFDVLVERRGLEKIRTAGEGYLVASGLARPRADQGEAMARLAIALHAEVARLNDAYNTSFRIRVGLSTGPLVAGVIGRTYLGYDLWGDVVNQACCLGALADAGTVAVAEPAYQRIQNKFPHRRTLRLEIKGQEPLVVYELELPGNEQMTAGL